MRRHQPADQPELLAVRELEGILRTPGCTAGTWSVQLEKQRIAREQCYTAIHRDIELPLATRAGGSFRRPSPADMIPTQGRTRRWRPAFDPRAVTNPSARLRPRSGEHLPSILTNTAPADGLPGRRLRPAFEAARPPLVHRDLADGDTAGALPGTAQVRKPAPAHPGAVRRTPPLQPGPRRSAAVC